MQHIIDIDLEILFNTTRHKYIELHLTVRVLQNLVRTSVQCWAATYYSVKNSQFIDEREIALKYFGNGTGFEPNLPSASTRET